MRAWTICASCALLFVGTIPGSGQMATVDAEAVVSPWERLSQGQVATGPRLTFDQMRLELGIVQDTKPVPFEFPFQNTGTELLVISNIKSSCKCTVPELEKKEYLPGERGVILATFDPHFRKGSENKAITITSNDTEEPTQRLLVHVTVDPVVDLEDYNYDIGDVIHGTSASVDVTLRTEMKDLRIVDMTISGPNVTWEILGQRTETIDPADVKPDVEEAAFVKHEEPYEVIETKVRFTVDDQTPLEPFRRSVEASLVLTDEAGQEVEHQVLFALTGRIVSDLWLRPVRVAAGRVHPGQAFSQTVRLSSRKGIKFKVLSVEHINGNGRVDPGEELAADMEVTYQQIGGDLENSMVDYRITLNGHAPQTPGRFFGTVLVHTDYEQDPILSIRYSGIAVEP